MFSLMKLPRITSKEIKSNQVTGNKRIDQSLADSESANLTEVNVLIEEIAKWN